MSRRFTRNIAPHVAAEFALARLARQQGRPEAEFGHLENAHVLGQASTRWHVRAHLAMLGWAIRNAAPREVVGQVMRVVGAATKTALGWVPTGNTGGSKVSPFRAMPLSAAHAAIIDRAKAGP